MGARSVRAIALPSKADEMATCMSRTSAALPPGFTSACTCSSGMPTAAATARALSDLSPASFQACWSRQANTQSRIPIAATAPAEQFFPSFSALEA